MATSIGNLDTSGAVRVEIDGDGAAGHYDEDFGRAVRAIAGMVAGVVQQIPEEQRPQELRLECGLKALPTGAFAISLGTAGANFAVSLTWRAEEQAGLLGGVVPQGETGPGF